jgi:hypothetical protein
MKTCKYAVAILCVFAVAFFAGCASQKPLWGDLETGFILQYHQEKGAVSKYNYNTSNDMTITAANQTMDMTIGITAQMSYSIEDVKADKITYKLLLEDVKITTGGSMGGAVANSIPDIQNMFKNPMLITSTKEGAEQTFINAKDFQQFQNIDMSGQDLAFIIEFPKGRVKVNDTWSSKQSTSQNTSGIAVRQTVNNNYVLAGIEKRMDYECVKIVNNFTISASGGGEQQGVTADVTGGGKGTTTLYFAYKEGKIIESVSQTDMTIAASVMGMSMPISGKTKSTFSLIK